MSRYGLGFIRVLGLCLGVSSFMVTTGCDNGNDDTALAGRINQEARLRRSTPGGAGIHGTDLISGRRADTALSSQRVGTRSGAQDITTTYTQHDCNVAGTRSVIVDHCGPLTRSQVQARFEQNEPTREDIVIAQRGFLSPGLKKTIRLF